MAVSYFDGVIDVSRDVSLATGHNLVCIALQHLPVDTNRVLVCVDEFLRLVTEVGLSPSDRGCALLRVVGRRCTSPENDTVGPGVSRGDTVGELELARGKRGIISLLQPALNVCHVDPQLGVPHRGTAVVDVAIKCGRSNTQACC